MVSSFFFFFCENTTIFLKWFLGVVCGVVCGIVLCTCLCVFLFLFIYTTHTTVSPIQILPTLRPINKKYTRHVCIHIYLKKKKRKKKKQSKASIDKMMFSTHKHTRIEY